MLLADTLCAVSLYLLGKVKQNFKAKQEAENKRSHILNDSQTLKCKNLTNALNTNNFGINDLEICKELSADISNMPESLVTNENTTQTDGCVPILMVIGIIIAGILNLLAICKVLLN